jgi:hypothetical protein
MAIHIDLTSAEGYAVPVDGAVGRTFQMVRHVDFTETANQLAQTEIMALFKVPAGVLVKEVMIYVETADADVSDVDIGNASSAGVTISADGFVDGATLASTGLKRDLAGETYSLQDGTAGYCSTSDTIIILTNNDADTINGAIVNFIARCEDCRG